MSWVDAVIYGLIQGLSEFLPVSSSGHLALLPHFLKLSDPGVAFDLMMHVGTGFAVLLYFRQDITMMVKRMMRPMELLGAKDTDAFFIKHFILATIASVSLILLLMPVAKFARHPGFIVFNLSFFGALLWGAEIFSKKNKSATGHDSFRTQFWPALALAVGLAQAVAIFPGVSRSGITLTAALFMGVGRSAAGRFSFLLSLPIIFAGAVKEIPELFHSTHSTQAMDVLLIGMVVSFISGLLTIHYFLKFFIHINLAWFSVYRWLVALLVWLVVLN